MELSIQKKWILSKRYFSMFREGIPVFVVVKNVSKRGPIVHAFTEADLSDEVGFLPLVSNRYSERNAEKWFTVDKDKPKDDFYYDLWCTRYRWAGKGKSEAYQDWVTIHRTRWHRDYHNPYEIKFFYDKRNDRFISEKIDFDDMNFPKIRNTVNLVLKVFGDCCLTDNDESYLGKVKVENWVFLPSGSWSQDKEKIYRLLGKRKKHERETIQYDIDFLLSYNPQELAVGSSGFKGYCCFRFEEKNICILETKEVWNATYVFDEDLWEDLSKKTKTEIIEGNLAKERVYHNKEWEKRIKELLG